MKVMEKVVNFDEKGLIFFYVVIVIKLWFFLSLTRRNKSAMRM